MGTLQTIQLGNFPFEQPYLSVGRERCENLYIEIPANQNAKTPYFYIKIPGMKKIKNEVVNIGACRALYTTGGGQTYTIHNNKFYHLLSNGVKELKGQINSYNGPVSIAENGYQMILVDGVNGWIFNYKDQTFTQITDEYFPGIAENTKAPTHVTYLDSYFIVNIPNSNQYQWSNSFYMRDHDDTTSDYDPAETQGYWTAIQMGQKYAKPDYINSILDCNNLLWLFGDQSIEVHYDTGDYTSQLWSRYEGGIIEIGCAAKYSPVKFATNIFWIGRDKSGSIGVYMNEGLTPKRISTRGIEQIISLMSDPSDAIGFTYSQAGHTFIVWQFIKGNKTLVYDVVTGAWHERTHQDKNTAVITNHKALFSTYNFGKVIVGHLNNSELFELSLKKYYNDIPQQENGFDYIRCVKTTPITYINGANVRYNSAQVVFSQGTGLNNDNLEGVGKDPLCMLAFSDDCGSSWNNERQQHIGKIGQYKYRTKFINCGMSRNRVWRITVSDPISVVLVGMITDTTPQLW